MFHLKITIMKRFEEVKVTMDKKTWNQVITAKENGKVVNLMPFNIYDNRPREIVCISTNADIKQGEVYTLAYMQVGAWKTWINLKETRSAYNSVDFAEMPNYVAPLK